jgi:hypothetical protein
MSATIVSRDKGYSKLLREVNLHGSVVKVGVLGPKGQVPKSGGKTSATVAEIAEYLHEGTDRMKPRPFIVVWFDENVDANRRFARLLAAERMAGRLTYDRSLSMMGARAVGGIQKRIADGPFEPNRPSTLRKKAPKTKPLIATGQLRSSIASEIVQSYTPGGE